MRRVLTVYLGTHRPWIGAIKHFLPCPFMTRTYDVHTYYALRITYIALRVRGTVSVAHVGRIVSFFFFDPLGLCSGIRVSTGHQAELPEFLNHPPKCRDRRDSVSCT